jgi:hypothetical protein
MSEDIAGSLPSVPKGFKIVREGDVLHIEHKHTGMSCMVVFLVVWLSMWTTGCVMIVKEIRDHPGFVLLAILFLIAEIFAAVILLWIFFGRTHYFLTPSGLLVTRRLFTWSKTRMFPMLDINGFKQVKDGGEGEDSFPSWGLVVVVSNNKSVKILSRQELQKSLWLGELLGKWSGKEFHKSVDQVIEQF